MTFQYDKLIIATGSQPVIPPCIPDVDYSKPLDAQLRKKSRILLCKNYEDAKRLCSLKDMNKVCILGAGHIGMELAWAYQSIGASVTILNHNEHIMVKYFDQDFIDILEDECKQRNIELLMKARVISISESQASVSIIAEVLMDQSIKTVQINYDYVILAIGFKPNTDFLHNKLQNVRGVLNVTERQQTSQQDVYAIGDCCMVYHGLLQKQTYMPLATSAIRQSIIASYQSLGIDLKQIGTNATYGIQLFDYSLASTGLNISDAGAQYPDVTRVMYSDFLWQPYCEKLTDNVMQPEAFNSQFTILGDLVRGLADAVVDSFDVDVAQSEEALVAVVLVYRDSGVLVGAQTMGKNDITQLANAASVALQCRMTAHQLAVADLGGVDGETKPWAVFQKAAASARMEVPDFDDCGIE